jgi:hypothetical protein
VTEKGELTRRFENAISAGATLSRSMNRQAHLPACAAGYAFAGRKSMIAVTARSDWSHSLLSLLALALRASVSAVRASAFGQV